MDQAFRLPECRACTGCCSSPGYDGPNCATIGRAVAEIAPVIPDHYAPDLVHTVCTRRSFAGRRYLEDWIREFGQSDGERPHRAAARLTAYLKARAFGLEHGRARKHYRALDRSWLLQLASAFDEVHARWDRRVPPVPARPARRETHSAPERATPAGAVVRAIAGLAKRLSR